MFFCYNKVLLMTLDQVSFTTCQTRPHLFLSMKNCIPSILVDGNPRPMRILRLSVLGC
jgi:hypothetical protein